jgi:undecaprenyl-phosphate 4-deoxy-4-formamido-L-arabinose transferase
MDISILIPVYNSEKSLPILLSQLATFFESAPLSYEVVLVNDASTDGTKGYLEKSLDSKMPIKVLDLPCNVGQQMALFKGLSLCCGDYVITCDDDLQHLISEFPKLLKAAGEGADLVFGIYDTYKGHSFRQGGSKVVGAFFRVFYPELNGLRVSSFRLIKQSVYKQAIAKDKHGFVYLSAELIPYAEHIVNISVKQRERIFGKSGYTIKKLVSVTCKLFWYYGLKKITGGRHVKTSHDGWGGKLPNKWY